MKYLTKEWSRLINAKESKKISDDYLIHVNKIYDKLPLALQMFSKMISLHDGIVEKISFIRRKNFLTLTAKIPTWSDWFFELEIKYINVSNIRIEQLISLFKHKKAEILYNEVDLFIKKKYVHRLLFSNENDLEIVFEDIEILIKTLHPDDFNENKRCKLEIR